MTQTDPDRFSDLEWMLDSSQEEEQALIKFLVQDQYAQVFQVCLIILGDPVSTRRSATQTLAAAAIKAYQYAGRTSAPAWIYRLAVETCLPRNTQKLPATALARTLFQELDLSIADTAYVLKVSEERVQAELEKTAQANKSGEQAGKLEEKPGSQVDSLQALINEDHQQVQAEVLQLVHLSHQRRRFSARIQEAVLVGLGLILAILLGRAAMATLPAPADPPTPTRPAAIAPVTPVPPLEPLTLSSSPNTIRQRILDSHHNWNTLWAEAETIRYGPPDYVGAPKVKRQQVWISQPDYSLTLSGSPEGDAELALLSSAGRVTAMNYSTGGLARYGHESLVDYSLPIHELLLPTRMRTTFDEISEVVGEDAVAGRETLVMDWFVTTTGEAYPDDPQADLLQYQGRFWVDTRTGVILRRQWFDQKNSGLLETEVVVREVFFDLPISSRLFDPSSDLPTRLARNSSSDPLLADYTPQPYHWQPQPERVPFPHRRPPADLDPSRSKLEFQWTSLSELDPSTTTRADIFAEDYYLGNVPFGDPRSLSCLRSPDGKLIAFTEWFEEPPYGARPLRWFSLEDLTVVREPLPDLISGNFTFSPDSRRLSLFACTRALEGCGLYLLDLQSGDYRRLVEMAFAGSLAWRPDGEYLAFKGARKPREESSLWVVSVRSGEITYNGPLDPESGQPAADSPILSWGVSLQGAARGVDTCATPPGD
ncbi:MAG TPA: hypothetical protein VI776_11895 [Anaerolineales bacterium]|nr:hypothetical protein [Anaerolineales bacterium]